MRSHKTKQLFLLLFKVALVSAICFFIYYKIYTHQAVNKASFSIIFPLLHFKWIVLLLIFTGVNWFLEVIKWKNLIAFFKNISLKESLRQVLMSHSISILTPNRIGEYGVKSLFYKNKDWKKIVFLNAFGNLAQLLTTITLGGLGIFYLVRKSPDLLHYFSLVKFIVFILSFCALLYFIKKFSIFSRQIDTTKRVLKQLNTSIKVKVTLLSFLRYLIFSHQFYFLLIIFQVEIDYFTAMSCITSMYLFASLVPSIFFLDAVIKGGVAIFLFSFFNIDEVSILITSLLMWIFNFALPAVIGSFYIFRFKSNLKFNLNSFLWKL